MIERREVVAAELRHLDCEINKLGPDAILRAQLEIRESRVRDAIAAEPDRDPVDVATAVLGFIAAHSRSAFRPNPNNEGGRRRGLERALGGTGPWRDREGKPVTP